MKTIYLFFITILFLLTFYSCSSREEVSKYAATEIFPEDTLLKTIQPKRAMIVIAHDDDMCAMSGTVSKLNKEGWEIAVVSFSKTPERNEAQIKACRNILDTVMFVELEPEQYRNDLDKEKNANYAISKEKFNDVFNKSIIEIEFINRINKFNPSIIFSLDNEIGGYGHPEHVFISQLLIDLSFEKKISPQFIYQSVFTDHMENSIMKRHSERMKNWGFPGDEWDNAKKIYNVTGMPEPNVQIDISSEAKLKMDYLRSYNKRERQILGFFMPEFEKYNAEEYFQIFNREFFRVIKIEN
jgi:LmbE family N-acetylglucosaminyl deacetylase